MLRPRFMVLLAAAGCLLPFTMLLMAADQQYSLAHKSKRFFYQKFQEQLVYVSNSTTPPKPQDDGLLSSERFQVVQTRMKNRREHLRSECSRTGLDDPNYSAYAWEYLINRQYHVIWCNIFKAASTSWMYNFNLMANYTAAFLDNTTDVPLELARRRYGRPTAEMVKKAHDDSITFLIVRHPLERLASAYSDKIVHPWKNSFHDIMGKNIIRKYRKAQPVNGKPVPKEEYPSFEEFISYLLDEARTKRTLDQHWTPYTDFCTPCKFDIDVILKFETMDEDQRYLIQLAGIQDVVKPEWRNSGGEAPTLHTSSLYSQITRAQLDGLHSLYKYDLQLFNYTLDSYYEILEKGDKE